MRSHRCFAITRKRGEQTISVAACRCGWRGDEQLSRGAALSQWDTHFYKETKKR